LWIRDALEQSLSFVIFLTTARKKKVTDVLTGKPESEEEKIKLPIRRREECRQRIGCWEHRECACRAGCPESCRRPGAASSPEFCPKRKSEKQTELQHGRVWLDGVTRHSHTCSGNARLLIKKKKGKM
jgi:hypothetical protein